MPNPYSLGLIVDTKPPNEHHMSITNQLPMAEAPTQNLGKLHLHD